LTTVNARLAPIIITVISSNISNRFILTASIKMIMLYKRARRKLRQAHRLRNLTYAGK
jgi:hypothetical protein